MKRFVVLLALLVLAGGAVFAQTDTQTVTFNITQVQLIEVDDNSTGVALGFDTATLLAGDPVSTGDTDSDTWLWYTVVGDGTGTITAAITASSLGGVALPGGTDLLIEALSAPNGTPAAGPLSLGSGAQIIVNTLGSGNTGRTSGTSGAQVEYTLDITDPAAFDLTENGANVTVTFTISAT